MARIRTIKPEFWTHEDLSLLPEATHMLAAALLNHADDEGYFNANPGLVKAATCPLREPSVSIQDSLRALENMGFIALYPGIDGKRYGQVIKFGEHQRVNRPTPSKIKGLCILEQGSLNDHCALTEDSPPERKGTGNREMEQGREGGSGEPDAAVAAPSRAKPAVTLRGYIDRRKAEGEKPIPKDHAVFAYAESAGIPQDFLTLAWHEFKSRYTTSPDDRKKYRDWPGVFMKAVKGNWLKVWYLDAGAYKLTTVGQQAELARGNSVH
jgi:hypothetical protein